MTNIQTTAGYILHRKKYKETGLWIDCFSEDQGRITIITKGQKKTQTPLNATLTPFTKLTLTLIGQQELKALAQAEPTEPTHQYTGNTLACAWYINEILYHLLPKNIPYPEFFTLYEKTLKELTKEKAIEENLRKFELQLLETLGYGIGFYSTGNHKPSLKPNDWYHFKPQQGFIPTQNAHPKTPNHYQGNTLIAIANQNWQQTNTLTEAKKLTRQALAPLLGNKTLHSRTLITKN